METLLKLALELVKLSEEEAPAKGGMPPQWGEFLDDVHDGGKERVPNPNTDTKSKYPDVAYSTALKDQGFRSKALKEYREWLKKKNKSEAAPKKETLVDDSDIDEMLKKHSREFDKIGARMQKSAKKFEDEFLPGRGKTLFLSLSPAERAVYAAGAEIGKYFEKSLSDEERDLHKSVISSWRDDSGSPLAHQLHGLLADMGVVGHQSAGDTAKSDKVKKDREAGGSDPQLRAYAKKVYSFTQAYLKHAGITELTLYRGVHKQIDSSPPETGDEISVKTREASSFSADYNVAKSFGRVLQVKVPGKSLFLSSLTSPKLHGDKKMKENEFVVLGASDLKAKVFT